MLRQQLNGGLVRLPSVREEAKLAVEFCTL